MRRWQVRTTALTIVTMALACRCAMAEAPSPTGARLWTAADLRQLDRTLISEMGKTGVASTYVIRGKTYGALLVHREVTGSAELHVELNDFFVVLGGEAAVKVGGRVVGEKDTGPDERLGRGLIGGTLYKVRQGDILFIPADHWLQVSVAKGEVLRVIVIKAQ